MELIVLFVFASKYKSYLNVKPIYKYINILIRIEKKAPIYVLCLFPFLLKFIVIRCPNMSYCLIDLQKDLNDINDLIFIFVINTYLYL